MAKDEFSGSFDCASLLAVALPSLKMTGIGCMVFPIMAFQLGGIGTRILFDDSFYIR